MRDRIQDVLITVPEAGSPRLDAVRVKTLRDQKVQESSKNVVFSSRNVVLFEVS